MQCLKKILIIFLSIIIGLSLIIYKGIKWEKIQEKKQKSISTIGSSSLKKNKNTKLDNPADKEQTVKAKETNIKAALIKAKSLGDNKKFEESLKILNEIEGKVNSSEENKEKYINRLNYLKQIMLNRRNDMKNTRSYPVNILMYHSINYEKGNSLRIPKEAFKSEISYLKDKGYEFSTMKEYLWRRENKLPFSKDTIILTFDDGYKDNYTNAYPVLKELQVPGTIFVITSTTDKDNAYLNSNDLKEMDDCFVDIESHTVAHEELNRKPYKAQVAELLNSKNFLEERLQRPVEVICYPSGKFNNDTIKAAQDTGYKLGVTTQPGACEFYYEPYKLHRIRIEASTLKSFEALMKNYIHE